VAGCAGSGRRRLAVLAVALTAASGAIAQAPPPAPPAQASTTDADARKDHERHAKKMDTEIKVPNNPDAALIEYLGEYGDAADGLDPLGLADPAVPTPKSGDGKG